MIAMRKNFFRRLWVVFCFWCVFGVPALEKLGAVDKLEPTAQMHAETLYMVRCLNTIHYNHRPLSTLSMDEILDVYLKNLDGSHLFFFQSDVEEIHSQYN
jgi:hypothetical protein